MIVEVGGGGFEVGEVGAGGFEGGEVGHFASDREPGFGGVNEARRVFGTALFGEFAGEVGGGVVPGEGEGAGGELGWAREVEAGRVEGLRTDLAGVDELGDGQNFNGGFFCACDGTVGGAKVNAKRGLHAIRFRFRRGR